MICKRFSMGTNGWKGGHRLHCLRTCCEQNNNNWIRSFFGWSEPQFGARYWSAICGARNGEASISLLYAARELIPTNSHLITIWLNNRNRIYASHIEMLNEFLAAPSCHVLPRGPVMICVCNARIACIEWWFVRPLCGPWNRYGLVHDVHSALCGSARDEPAANKFNSQPLLVYVHFHRLPAINQTSFWIMAIKVSRNTHNDIILCNACIYMRFM